MEKTHIHFIAEVRLLCYTISDKKTRRGLVLSDGQRNAASYGITLLFLLYPYFAICQCNS